MRILKAFAWLRWRVLMNSLERSGARDAVERFSLAIEQLGPIMAAVLMIPSAILLAGAGTYGGWALAQGIARPLPFEILRFLLLASSVLSVVGPLLLPGNSRTNAVRLLLLPISRRMLYLAQAVTALADPWVLLAVPVIAAVPVGLAVGGAWGAALVAAAAGLLLVAVLAGLASLATTLFQLVVRDRRRGELLTLLFMLIILAVAGMLPGLLAGGSRNAERDRVAEDVRTTAVWLRTLDRRVFPLVPSEMYVRATRAPARGRVADAAGPVVGLLAAAGLLHAAGRLAFGRVLDSPAAAGGRRRALGRRSRTWIVPGLSDPASAIAIAQIRLALRTPRGRSTLLTPVMVLAMFAVMMWRGLADDFSVVPLASGVALAIFGSFVSLLAIIPLAMNQFAIDGAGLTLEFLLPLDDRDLLRGKAVGNGVVTAVPALVCTAAAAALFPGGPPSLWISIPIGIAAAYLLVVPVAATLSALFPRAVDLNSIGHGSNAHVAATLLGLLACFLASAVPLALAVVAIRLLERPHLTPVLMLLWCALCALMARLLFVPARAVLVRRRENLTLIR